ncbi:hypothetical protein [Deinococcus koreensis]|uniref:hypothetical protein n=1 Tax=Deinococcus koreensis TaxID=2054903 RepID=UPI001057309E|nr:hypothetical protein [Deinococcus koreensis]
MKKISVAMLLMLLNTWPISLAPGATAQTSSVLTPTSKLAWGWGCRPICIDRERILTKLSIG